MHELYSIPLRSEDIDLITFALRRLAAEASFVSMKADAENLIPYIEREHADRKREASKMH